jgi:hypothetical protein
MTGAVNVNPRQLVRTLDSMLKSGEAEGWDALEAMFKPALVGAEFRPADPVLMFLGGMTLSEVGQATLEWLFDLTNRAPYPRDVGNDFQSAALAAKAHAARAAVGEAILQAVIEGRRIIEERKGATT